VCFLLGINLNLIQGGAKRTHVFQIIVTLFIFNIKKVMFNHSVDIFYFTPYVKGKLQ
jgi:hypothetical protein